MGGAACPPCFPSCGVRVEARRGGVRVVVVFGFGVGGWVGGMDTKKGEGEFETDSGVLTCGVGECVTL